VIGRSAAVKSDRLFSQPIALPARDSHNPTRPMGARTEDELRTCPRCGERSLTTVELTSGVRDVCLACGYYRRAHDHDDPPGRDAG
jgi:ribosomal protein L37E